MGQIMIRLGRQLALLLAIAWVAVGCSGVPSVGYNPWQQVPLPVDVALQDLGFTDGTAERGWLVGARSTVLQTDDGGQTWHQREIDPALLEDKNYTFTSVSFAGDEGWIVGEPSIALHTADGGQTWRRVPLSEKLPGTPSQILALGPGSAEMVTDIGAIYRTDNNGYNWSALVQEAVGVARNIERSLDGRYIAVSARGNFYSIWEPGDMAWQPFNRNSSRRVQNMGFGADSRLWMLARGGQVQFSEPGSYDSWQEAQYPEFSASWGLLAAAYRTPEEIWVAGGSGNLLCSFDGGQTWRKDRDVEGIPANLYKILFLSEDKGFILGNGGTLLTYEPLKAVAGSDAA